LCHVPLHHSSAITSRLVSFCPNDGELRMNAFIAAFLTAVIRYCFESLAMMPTALSCGTGRLFWFWKSDKEMTHGRWVGFEISQKGVFVLEFMIAFSRTLCQTDVQKRASFRNLTFCPLPHVRLAVWYECVSDIMMSSNRTTDKNIPRFALHARTVTLILWNYWWLQKVGMAISPRRYDACVSCCLYCLLFWGGSYLPRIARGNLCIIYVMLIESKNMCFQNNRNSEKMRAHSGDDICRTT